MSIVLSKVKFNDDEDKQYNEKFTSFEVKTSDDMIELLAAVETSISLGNFVYLTIDKATGNHILRELTD